MGLSYWRSFSDGLPVSSRKGKVPVWNYGRTQHYGSGVAHFQIQVVVFNKSFKVTPNFGHAGNTACEYNDKG